MADTALKGSETKEFLDAPDVFEAKVKTVAKWLREAAHAMVFSGAGISTSTGIRDFRSGLHTCLETGAGVWTERAAAKRGVRPTKKATKKVASTLKAVPSPTHMALIELLKANFIAAHVSQNTDGLNRRSGFPPDKLCELHGNTNLEVCTKCKKHYLRDFRVRNAKRVHNHKTGRTCTVPSCGGDLKDTIINFGEDLNEKVINKAFKYGSESDVCLAMGSSLRVTPAADIPERVARRGKLVIVNLQRTPLDSVAALVVHAKVDDFTRALMAELGLPIPAWKLTRYVEVGNSSTPGKGRADGSITTFCRSTDVDGTPFTLFKSCTVALPSAYSTSTPGPQPMRLQPQPYKTVSGRHAGTARFRCEFAGHYKEPPIEFSVKLNPANGEHSVRYKIELDMATGKWSKTVLARDGVPVEDTAAGEAVVATTTGAGAGAGAGTGPAAASGKTSAGEVTGLAA